MWSLPAPGTHLRVALAAGASDWDGGALHSKLGQEPHGLEREQTLFHPWQNKALTDHSEAFLRLLQELQNGV